MEKKFNYTTQLYDFCSLEANWWVFGVRGILSFIFGSLAIAMPLDTVLALTIFFGAYAVVDGIFSIVSGINRARKGKQWGGMVLSGIVGIIAGLIILIMPQVSSISLVVFLWSVISMWAIFAGSFTLASAIRLHRESQGGILLALNGAMWILFGISIIVMLWLNPLASLVTLGFFIGMNALASGIVFIMLAFKLFNLQQKSLADTTTTQPTDEF